MAGQSRSRTWLLQLRWARPGLWQRPAAHCSAVEEPEDGALPELWIRVHTWDAGRDGELTKRGPAAVRLVVCWLAAGRVTGFPAPAAEPDLALVQGSTVPVQLALGHPRVSEATDVRSGRPPGSQPKACPGQPCSGGVRAPGGGLSAGPTKSLWGVRLVCPPPRPALNTHTASIGPRGAPETTALSSHMAGRCLLPSRHRGP